jgi:hypothetical protein
MADHRAEEHPDLDRLAEYAAGGLDGTERAQIGEHLGACPACRIEVMQLQRFEQPAEDGVWDEAAPRVDRMYDEKLRSGPSEAMIPRIRRVRRRRWLATAAAAAALALLVLGTDLVRFGGDDPGARLPDPMRRGGDAEMAVSIAPLRPLGEIDAAPDTFAWRCDADCDSYTLEIYTEDLKTVFQSDRLSRAVLAMPDSLRAGWAPGETYLWSVQGYRGLDVVATSLEIWFRIVR